MLQAFLGVETDYSFDLILVMSLSSLDLLVLFSLCHMLLEVHYFSFLKFKFSKCSLMIFWISLLFVVIMSIFIFYIYSVFSLFL